MRVALSKVHTPNSRCHNRLHNSLTPSTQAMIAFIKATNVSFFADNADRATGLLADLRRALEDSKYSQVRVAAAEALQEFVNKINGSLSHLSRSIYIYIYIYIYISPVCCFLLIFTAVRL